MKITDYQIQKNEKRVSVFIDGEYMFSVTKDNFILNNLYIGKELNKEEIIKIEQEDERERAFSYILYQLGFGAKTEKELRQKMNKQKYGEEAQNYAIQKASEYDYVNDIEYCENFINQHKNLSGWGEQKIISALIAKGIKRDIIKEKIDEFYGYDEQFNNAYKEAKKKISLLKNKDIDERKIRQKLYMFLGGKGYSYDVIQDVLLKIANE